MNYEELLVSNLALVEKLIEFVCRRHALFGADAEDFASVVKLRLVEDNYSILRRFEGKGSLAGYLGIVVYRTFLTYRSKHWGRWRASTRAENAGHAAVLLEIMVHRDGIEPNRALQTILKRYPQSSPEALAAVLRGPGPSAPVRPRFYPVTENCLSSNLTADGGLLLKAREELGARASITLRATIESWPVQDQLIIRMRYADSLNIATVARMLQLDQKWLYGQVKRLLRRLREALIADGISLDDLRTLLEGGSLPVNFGLEELAGGEISPKGTTKEERKESPPAFGERETA